mmetsp:Transcript_102511/g.313461  ORF Transcript_102511/g.313461 Transcript_102511/m.313461 type:complete len:207 (-) Transcript_102511:229-849(-)
MRRFIEEGLRSGTTCSGGLSTLGCSTAGRSWSNDWSNVSNFPASSCRHAESLQAWAVMGSLQSRLGPSVHWLPTAGVEHAEVTGAWPRWPLTSGSKKPYDARLSRAPGDTSTGKGPRPFGVGTSGAWPGGSTRYRKRTGCPAQFGCPEPSSDTTYSITSSRVWPGEAATSRQRRISRTMGAAPTSGQLGSEQGSFASRSTGAILSL